MIGFIRGTVEYMENNFVVIENNGVGYNINVSNNTLERLPKGGMPVTIYTYMNVTDDAISLFGFVSMEELKMFKLLKTVSGVGPRVALALLASLSPNELALAIASNDASALCVQGVGKKLSQRIALELKDKVDVEAALGTNAGFEGAEAAGEAAEALEALLSLGFSRSEAVKAVSGIETEGESAEAIVKAALKKLSRQD